MKSVCYYGTTLDKTGMCRQMLEKIRNVKLKSSSGGSNTNICRRSDRRTDGHDVAESRFSRLFVKAVNEYKERDERDI
jgi:hypothetical protein